MTLDQLYSAAQQHVLSRNNPTSPVDVSNILLNYIAENGGGGGSSGLPESADIVAVNASRNLLATDVGKLLLTTGNVVLTFDVTESIPTDSIIYILAGDSSTVAFDVADDEVIEGGSTVLQAGQQAELVFIGANTAVLVRRSVDGTAINPLSIGATTGLASLHLANEAEIVAHEAGGAVQAKLYFDNGYFGWMARNAADTDWGSLYSGYCSVGHLVVRDANYGFGIRLQGTLISSKGTANKVCLSNGANAQTFEIYGTDTSSTVYERLSSKYDSGSGAFVIGTEKGASGGSARNLIIRRDGTDVVTFTSTGLVIAGAGHCGNDGGMFSVGFGLSASGNPEVLFGSSQIIFSDHITCLGNNTASYPALKRNGTGIDFRLADDSADAPITVSTVKTVPVLYSALPDAATIGDGARAFITDGASAYPANIGGMASGVGANPTPVMTLGGAWIYG